MPFVSKVNGISCVAILGNQHMWTLNNLPVCTTAERKIGTTTDLLSTTSIHTTTKENRKSNTITASLVRWCTKSLVELHTILEFTFCMARNQFVPPRIVFALSDVEDLSTLTIVLKCDFYRNVTFGIFFSKKRENIYDGCCNIWNWWREADTTNPT